MEQRASLFHQRKQAGRKQREEERKTLRASLASTQAQLHQAYCGFNLASDQDLVESYVFEIKALQSRYDYLLRQIKELERVP